MIYYLVKNENGFEHIMKEGSKIILEKDMDRFKKRKNKKIKYYILEENEWCLSCPLIPVDYS